MRRIPALLCVAGLATAPASVAAGPSNDPWSTTRSQTVEKRDKEPVEGSNFVDKLRELFLPKNGPVCQRS